MNLFLLILAVLYSEVLGKSAGRGGGRVGGRGGGGARAGVGRGGGRGTVHGSSHYNAGFRSGSMGWKKGSSSPSTNYGSGSFRSALFSPSAQSSRPIFTSSLSSAFIIASIARPITYDNRFYYWSSSYAQENLSPVEFPILCEYQFGEDDGQLQNVTFSNGTLAQFLYFGCPGEMVECCGMYCCHAIGDYIKLTLVFGLLLVLVPICYYCAKSDKSWTINEENEGEIPLVKLSQPPNKRTTTAESTVPEREKLQTIT